MTYTADYLIERRKTKWDELGSIEYDKKLRSAIADELLTNSKLLDEVKTYPEKLIELFFIVVDKDKKTRPFFFNAVQKEFVETLNQAKIDFAAGLIPEISILILKGRQQGFTTFVTAYQLACSILNRNFEGFTLADESSNTEAIFQNKAKYPYSQLPDALKPTEKFNNRRQLLFEKLNSSWAVDTATKDVGRSRTINFFHGSECAFWRDGISPIQAALGQAFTRDCIKIYETTANGFNDYKKMWDSGEHINCFYAWWKTPEYRLKFPADSVKTEFNDKIDKRTEWIWERLKWLRDEVKLDLEQLYWYYKKYKGFIDKGKIKQEYPCTPHEAFLLSGATVFDTEKILARIEQVERPVKVGYFAYDYDGLKISNIRWVPDRNGYVKIYQLPDTPRITKYCVGGDTAGEGSDWFTGHVLDAKTGQQVAVLKHQFDEDQYAKQMYCLGAYYKWALMCIETNYSSYPIMELQRLGYPNMYVRYKQDTYTHKMEKYFGFKTTTLTRPTIIARLIEIVREHIDLIYDLDTLEELLTIIRNEKGKIEAPEGGNDDQMMGLAIAHEAREQVSFSEEEIYADRTYQFSFEEEGSGYDYGETIEVI